MSFAKHHRWALAILLAATSSLCSADPQHWGFGFGYLVTLEQRGEQRALSIYAPPMHVQDADWLLRWRDQRPDMADVLPRGLVVGNFWPQKTGSENVLLLRAGQGTEATVETLAIPEVFSTSNWESLGRTRLPLELIDGTKLRQAIAYTAGDLLGQGVDQLLVLGTVPAEEPRYVVVIFAPPSNPDTGLWRPLGTVPIQPFGRPANITAGDFYGLGKDQLSVLSLRRADTVRLSYWEVTQPAFETFEATNLANDAVEQITDRPTFFEAADYLRDGIAYVALGSPSQRSRRFITRVAPRLESRNYSAEWIAPGETLGGAKLDDLEPGQAKRLSLGQRDGAFGLVVAAGAGRIFGYIEASATERESALARWEPNNSGVDVEIVAVRRLPEYRLGIPEGWHDGTWSWSPDDHFGWPKENEPVRYEILLKNNGPDTIPAGAVKVQLWGGVAARNADVLPNASETRSTRLSLASALPPFNPRDPQFAKLETSLKWPYKLEQPEGWTWKRLNLREVGPRWLIARVSAEGDQNLRNNRFEFALHAKQLRAVIRDPAEYDAKAAEAPTVSGDPASYTYRLRKLADALQVIWERARTADGQGILQAVTLAPPRVGWPATRNDDDSLYDIVREVDPSVGLWGEAMQFGTQSATDELRRAGCELHLVRDQLRDEISPTDTRLVREANGEAVVHSAEAWGADICVTGHTVAGLLAADMQKRLEGVRYAGVMPVEGLSPASISVRVLDRSGQPLPAADVSWHMVSRGEQKRIAEGRTDANGVWKTELPGSPSKQFAPFGWNIYSGDLFQPGAYVCRMSVGEFSESAVVGLSASTAHSRRSLAHAAFTDSEGWTWTFNTQFDPAAKVGEFSATAAISGNQVSLVIESKTDRVYHVYRQVPPREEITLVGEYQGTREPLRVALSLPTNRRATFWVSEVNDRDESLPQRVQTIPLNGLHGISAMADGRCLVTLNSGSSDPVLVRFDGTRLEELLHRDPLSETVPWKALALSGSDRVAMTLQPPSTSERGSFALINFDMKTGATGLLSRLSEGGVKRFTPKSPFEIVFEKTDRVPSMPILPGDRVLNPLDQSKSATITGIETDRFITDGLIYNVGQLSALRLAVDFRPGGAGDQLELRQLNNPRGLDLMEYRGDELVLIADTGNRRVVLWTAETKPLAEFRLDDWNPVSVAAHPINTGQFFVLSRQADRQSALYLLRYDGRQISVLSGFPVPLDVGAVPDGSEMGLCAAVEPERRQLTLAITDATQQRVLELVRFGNEWRPIRTHTTAMPPYAGPSELQLPTDLAYTIRAGELALYVVDQHQRVVRVR